MSDSINFLTTMSRRIKTKYPHYI